MSTQLRAQARAATEQWLAGSDLSWEQTGEYSFVVSLPGVNKQQTNTSIQIGPHFATIQAFVSRHPDENAGGLHRWLLERNSRLYGVSYCIDELGDVYLSGRFALAAISENELDRILGSVLENADGSFNTILELGFSSAIRREWQWRLSRGETTGNLAAFRHLADPDALREAEAQAEADK